MMFFIIFFYFFNVISNTPNIANHNRNPQQVVHHPNYAIGDVEKIYTVLFFAHHLYYNSSLNLAFSLCVSEFLIYNIYKNTFKNLNPFMLTVLTSLVLNLSISDNVDSNRLIFFICLSYCGISVVDKFFCKIIGIN